MTLGDPKAGVRFKEDIKCQADRLKIEFFVYFILFISIPNTLNIDVCFKRKRNEALIKCCHDLFTLARKNLH